MFEIGDLATLYRRSGHTQGVGFGGGMSEHILNSDV